MYALPSDIISNHWCHSSWHSWPHTSTWWFSLNEQTVSVCIYNILYYGYITKQNCLFSCWMWSLKGQLMSRSILVDVSRIKGRKRTATIILNSCLYWVNIKRNRYFRLNAAFSTRAGRISVIRKWTLYLSILDCNDILHVVIVVSSCHMTKFTIEKPPPYDETS